MLELVLSLLNYTIRLNKPNGVSYMSNTTLLIWMQAKLSFLYVQNSAICYFELDASKMEFLGHLLIWTVQINIVYPVVGEIFILKIFSLSYYFLISRTYVS